VVQASDLKTRVRQELAFRAVARDPLAFAEQCWYIQHPMGPRRFELRDPQREALQTWVNGSNSLTLKARQIGWSTLVGFFSTWMAYFHPGTRILFLSKGEREAQELLLKATFGADRLPTWLTRRGPRITQRNQSLLRFSNDSEIQSLPSGNNPARGFTGRLVVVDEWAFLPNPEEAWGSIEPVADIGGQIIGLSTANGVGNLFYDLWVRARNGDLSFEPMFYGWWAVPERDDSWYSKKKADFSATPWLLHQEYPDNEREAFIKSGQMVYNPDILDSHAERATEPTWVGDLRHGNPEFPRSFTPIRNDQGYLRVWEWPQDDKTYVIGADVAEGLEHGDYSSAHVMCAQDGRVVATWHGHLEADLFGVELFKLGLWYNTALVLCEVNNHGLTTVTELRRWKYPRVWRRRIINSANGGWSVEFGWKTTKVTKPLMVDDLGQYLREYQAEAVLLDDMTTNELMTFVRDSKGGMNGSPFDDRVISLALAVQALEYAASPEYQAEMPPPEGSHGWFDKMVEDMERDTVDEGAWVIG
jgi:hypothetical protein